MSYWMVRIRTYIHTHTHSHTYIHIYIGGPVSKHLRQELEETRMNMRMEVSSHEALRHRLGRKAVDASYI